MADVSGKDLRTSVLKRLKNRLVVMKRDMYELEQMIHDVEHTWFVGDRVTCPDGLDGEVSEVMSNGNVRVSHTPPFVETTHSRFRLSPARR